MKRTRIQSLWKSFCTIIALGSASLLLAACGGGGGGGDDARTAGLAAGEIEGFGSIIVNGVKFEVEGAEVEFEHGIVTINQAVIGQRQDELLNEGMQVEIEGTFNGDGTGTATRIIVDDEVEGPIDAGSLAIDPNSGVVTFTILGQPVVAIPGATRVDAALNGLLTNLTEGEFYEVHGLPDGSAIQATFIELKAATQADFDNLPNNEGELELTGIISTYTPASNQFTVGAQLIDYSAPSAAPDGLLDVGIQVEVKGSLNGAVLEATRVHVEDGLGDNIARVEIEGVIRNLGNGEFTLNGESVAYSGATRYFGGTESDLANGIKVEAEGPVAGGTLTATKITFKDSFRYEGQATYDAAGQTLTINIPSGGALTVHLDPNVTAEDPGIDYQNRNVKIRARVMAGTNLVATRVNDGGSLDNRSIFRAPVVDFDAGSQIVELLDDGSDSTPAIGLLEFNTTALQDGVDSDFEIDFGDGANQDLSRATFYSTLQVGDQVKVRYTGPDEDKIEIEIDD